MNVNSDNVPEVNETQTSTDNENDEYYTQNSIAEKCILDNSETLNKEFSQTVKNAIDNSEIIVTDASERHDCIDIVGTEPIDKKNLDVSDMKTENLDLQNSLLKEKVQHCIKIEMQLKELEETNKNLLNEIAEMKIRINEKEALFMKEQSKIKAEFLTAIEKLSKECSVLRKEKEAIVIKYANSEKEVIMTKKVQNDLEKKIQEIIKERDLLSMKLKSAVADNVKLSTTIENKMIEIAKLQKDNEKLNADINSREIKIKWLQNNLKTEANAHQDTKNKLEQTSHRLNEMREEAEQVRRDCQDMIKRYQEAEEIKSVKLDSQLKQKLSEIAVQEQKKSDQEQINMFLKQELEALKKNQRSTIEDNNNLTLKVNSLEKERLEYEQSLCKLKDVQNKLKEEITDLTSQLVEMESLKLQLEQEKEKSAATLREVERLRSINAELQCDIDACHLKEGDRLDFVEKLTAKAMHLQSDYCLLEVKAQALKEEVNQLNKTVSDLQATNSKLAEELEDSKNEHEHEMQLLIQKLAEKAKLADKLSTNLEEVENENRVLKRRHIATIKELSHELYQCRKQIEYYESNYGVCAESVSLGSRTSSSTSLQISNSNDNCVLSTSPSVTCSTKKDTSCPQTKIVDNKLMVDNDVLIERIINLQTMLAKKNDKIDFLEDHIEHLVREMRKKSKTVDFKNV